MLRLQEAQPHQQEFDPDRQRGPCSIAVARPTSVSRSASAYRHRAGQGTTGIAAAVNTGSKPEALAHGRVVRRT